jgi:hypothetical protein
MTDLNAAHQATANKSHPDRTAIAAQMLAAMVSADPIGANHSDAELCESAVDLADALLLALASRAPAVADTVPDRAAPTDRQELLDALGISTLRFRNMESGDNALRVARAVVALAEYDGVPTIPDRDPDDAR